VQTNLDALDPNALSVYAVSNAFGWANLSDRTGSRSRDVCIRLQCRDHAGTGDAVLQINALLIAWSSWSGLLQGHANDARSFYAALVRAWLVRLPSCIRGCACVGRMPWLRFLCADFRSAVPRPTHLLLPGFPASSHLISPPVVSQLHMFVCLESLSLLEGKTREISEGYSARTRPMAGARRAVLCFKSQRARTSPGNSSALVSGRRPHLL
jgi:hypothetical protein